MASPSDQNVSASIKHISRYMAKIGKIIAEAQITNGGPVILFQPENEYMFSDKLPTFPDRVYIEYIINQARAAGIVVPLLSNDGNNRQRNITVPGYTDVDILVRSLSHSVLIVVGLVADENQGYDTYPLGFNCVSSNTYRRTMPHDERCSLQIHCATEEKSIIVGRQQAPVGF